MTSLKIFYHVIRLTSANFQVLLTTFLICHEGYFLGSPINNLHQSEFSDSDKNLFM